MLPQIQVTYRKDGRVTTQIINSKVASPLYKDVAAYVQFHLGATLIDFKKV